MTDQQQLEVLDRVECMALLETVRVGRLVFTEGALPAVQPVNFRMHDEQVVLRVAGGGKLAAAINNSIVAFEVDDLDPDLRSGWSVTVVGHACLITDVEELVEVSGIWLQPWVVGRRDNFVRIKTEQVNGRRLVPIGYGREPRPRSAS